MRLTVTSTGAVGGIGLLLLALFWPWFAAAQAPKIGYVDMKRLLDNAPQVTAARKRIESDFRERDQLLKAEQKRLGDLRTRQSRDAAVMTKEAADALAREVDTIQRLVDRTTEKLRTDLNARREEELNRRWPEINDVVIAYARSNGYDLVLPAPVLYASANVDITDQVLAQLRRQAESDPPR